MSSSFKKISPKTFVQHCVCTEGVLIGGWRTEKSLFNSNSFFVFQSIQDRSCLRLIRKFQHMLSSGRRSMPVSDTATNTETATGLSVITDVEQQTVDSVEVNGHYHCLSNVRLWYFSWNVFICYLLKEILYILMKMGLIWNILQFRPIIDFTTHKMYLCSLQCQMVQLAKETTHLFLQIGSKVIGT